MRKRPWLKRIGWTIVVLFVLMNSVAAIHAWKFTHFSDPGDEKSTTDDNALWLALTGIDNPRPENKLLPLLDFTTVEIVGTAKLNCWRFNAPSSAGTVLLFHGYGGCKSGMMGQAEEFLQMNYSVIVADFRGCGDSEGNCTTVGYYEAEDVKAVYDY